MKTQMRFQSIVFKVMLVLSALTILYALAFCTGAITYIGHVHTDYGVSYTASQLTERFGGEDNYNTLLALYDSAQSYTDLLLWLGIAFILIVVVGYIFAGAKRRNYYLSNYITVGLIVVYAVVWAVIAIALSAQIQSGILSDAGWEAFGNYYNSLSESRKAQLNYSTSTWIYVVGYILALLVIADAAALVYSCIWKFKLMKGEKELLKNGLVKEVA